VWRFFKEKKKKETGGKESVKRRGKASPRSFLGERAKKKARRRRARRYARDVGIRAPFRAPRVRAEGSENFED
jgi:hypothetical protein